MTVLARCQGLAPLVFVATLAVGTALAESAAPNKPDGTYVVIAMRNASDVASTISAIDAWTPVQDTPSSPRPPAGSTARSASPTGMSNQWISRRTGSMTPC
ncbi:MAG: hypothetical protein HOL02_01295 [Rhodospirillaceae bacterium]|jgi:hypothetical protein|nr:hypothetical protein [Rhodospirillaceae bacterium]